MVSEKTADVARRAKQLYEEKLRTELEATNMNDFVAIEPDSGDYFFGKTLSQAIQASRRRTQTAWRKLFSCLDDATQRRPGSVSDKTIRDRLRRAGPGSRAVHVSRWGQTRAKCHHDSRRPIGQQRRFTCMQ